MERVPWAAVVLTLPPGPRESATGKDARQALRRAAWQVTSAWVAWWCFHNDVTPADLGGVVLFHPAGEAEEEWHPHFNVLIPLRALRDGRTRDGRWKVPELALHDLRARWAAVCRAWGFQERYAVQVRYQPRLERRQRIHAARYYGRGFPGWAAELQRPVYYGLLRSLRKLPNGEPERWPMEPRRCECGGHWRTIAHERNGLWVYLGGTGPPMSEAPA